MKRNMITIALSFVLLAGVSFSAMAQEVAVMPKPEKVTGKAVDAKPSPMAVASMKSEEGYIKVVYSQPHLKKRKMLGEKEPYGKVWRLGANEATEITLTEDTEFNGEELEAGTYSMFAIPEEDKWTIIFNKALGQWGAYSYDESKDALRVEAPVEEAEKTFEPFTIWFSADGSAMHMAWGDTQVNLPVEIDG